MGAIGGSIPKSEVMGNGQAVKVEESWNKFVPSTMGADGVGVPEINRNDLIMEAVRRKKMGTHIQTEQMRPGPVMVPGPALDVVRPEGVQYFFVVKGKKIDFIGSSEVDLSKFRKDISGRFFREWLKKEFPDRRDYDDIVTFSEYQTLKDVIDLMELAGA